MLFRVICSTKIDVKQTRQEHIFNLKSCACSLFKPKNSEGIEQEPTAHRSKGSTSQLQRLYGETRLTPHASGYTNFCSQHRESLPANTDQQRVRGAEILDKCWHLGDGGGGPQRCFCLRQRTWPRLTKINSYGSPAIACRRYCSSTSSLATRVRARVSDVVSLSSLARESHSAILLF